MGIGASPCQQTKCFMPNLSRIAAEQTLCHILRMDLYSLLITFQMAGHFVLTRNKTKSNASIDWNPTPRN